MPALYKGWNEEGKDIQLNCVGDNLPQGLTSDVLARLTKILPWAEAATPVLGTSSPGNLFTQAAQAIGGAISGAAQAVGNYFSSAPVADTGPGDTANTGAGVTGLIQKAGGITGSGYGASGRMCARGVSGILKAAGLITNNGAASGFPAASNLAIGGSGYGKTTWGSGYTNPFTTGSGAQNFQAPVAINPSNYQPRIGDAVYAGGGGQGYGHAQIYLGKDSSGKDLWYSDFKQKSGFLSNYNNFTLYRPTDAARQKLLATLGVSDAGIGPGAATAAASSSDYASQSGAPTSSANTHQTAQGSPTVTQEGTGLYGVNADPNAANNAASSGASTATTFSLNGISPGALEYAMRTAAAESGANGTNTPNTVLKEINNVNNTIAMSQGIKNGYEVRGVSFARIDQIANELKSSGKVNVNVLDIGYTQHNASDMKAYGIQNYGSYKDQILSVARHVQNTANRNPSFAAALASGNFQQAEALNVVRGWNNTIYNSGMLANKNSITNLINSQYGGDPQALLEALNAKYPTTPDINSLLAGSSSTTVPGGDVAPVNQAAALAQNTNLVNNTSSAGPVTTQNLNNMAKGVFSYPAAGAMLWVFFREGNPLYPVYFAASYSAAEWQSAYRYGSPGPGYNPTPQNGEPQSTGGVMNLNGVGGIRWEDTNSPSDRTFDQKSLTIFGEDGSNMHMGSGYHQLYSRFTRRDQVDQDRHDTTLGYKETWVQGDANLVVMGDYYIKVGNVSQKAVDAVTEIQKIIKEIQAPLSETLS